MKTLRTKRWWHQEPDFKEPDFIQYALYTWASQIVVKLYSAELVSYSSTHYLTSLTITRPIWWSLEGEERQNCKQYLASDDNNAGKQGPQAWKALVTCRIITQCCCCTLQPVYQSHNPFHTDPARSVPLPMQLCSRFKIPQVRQEPDTASLVLMPVWSSNAYNASNWPSRPQMMPNWSRILTEWKFLLFASKKARLDQILAGQGRMDSLRSLLRLAGFGGCKAGRKGERIAMNDFNAFSATGIRNMDPGRRFTADGHVVKLGTQSPKM